MNKSDNKKGFIQSGIKALMMLLLAVICVASFSTVDAYAEDDDWVHYYGIVTADTVNVRTGPGVKYDKVLDENGKSLQVVGQQELIILGEDKADDGNTWYKIQFEKGGKTYEGFSSGSYIAKDDSKGVITPSPTPAPTSTPTPSPTPVELITNTPVPTTSLIKDKDKNTNPNDSKTTKTVIIIILVIFALFVGFFIAFSVRKNKRRNAVRSSRKVDRIRRYEQEGSGNSNNSNAGKRRPEIRRSAEEDAYTSPARKDVYYTNEQLNDEEDILASLSKETDTKRQLRAAIDNLQEHDIITHVVYGEGEVYDNSDVKLIEVRFGNDVRFLNKESLVNKGLIQVVDEEEQAVARRRSRRKKKD